MKCPECGIKLYELSVNNSDYERGFNYSCRRCQCFWTIVGESK